MLGTIIMNHSTKYRLSAKNVVAALMQSATPERARVNEWFFKTGKGEYGEGDRFIGVSVPEIRKVAKEYRTLALGEVARLLASPVHEVRLAGLLILTYVYERAHPHPVKKENRRQKATYSNTNDRYQMSRERGKGCATIVRFYLAHLNRVNNWDLVDLSAPQILGAYFRDYGGEKKLYMLARSTRLWNRRIAIVATYAFIRVGIFTHTLAIAEMLLGDTHDLIHKAVGWMLREVGKRDEGALEAFLRSYGARMPRTMLRYAIEKFPESKRKALLVSTRG